MHLFQKCKKVEYRFTGFHDVLIQVANIVEYCNLVITVNIALFPDKSTNPINVHWNAASQRPNYFCTYFEHIPTAQQHGSAAPCQGSA